MSKSPPDPGTTPEETIAIDIGDLANRLAALEQAAIPFFVGMPVPYLNATIGSLVGEQEVRPSFLLANGAAVGRTKWPQLFSEYGVKYGAGDGSSTFALPDLTGKVIVPRSAAGTFNVAAGTAGGAETVSLSTAQLPMHNHSGSTASATPSLTAGTGYASIGNAYNAGYPNMPETGLGGNNALNVSGGSYAAGSHMHYDAGHQHAVTGSISVSLNLAQEGSGQGHSNLQPYVVIEGWLIYAGVQAL